jgi:hypothetical protein
MDMKIANIVVVKVYGGICMVVLLHLYINNKHNNNNSKKWSRKVAISKQ